MATLPDATALGLARAPTPSRKAIAGYDGGAVFRAMQGAGQALGEVADRAQREEDANAVFAARKQLDDWERGAIFGEKGAANKLGRDAFNVPAELGKSFDEVAGKVGESLTTDRQRAAFRELVASRRAQVLDWGEKHAMRERNVYEAGQFKAELDSMADRAVLFPDRAAGELAIARQRIVGFMQGKGRSPEEIQQAIKDQESRTHSAVITSMLNAGNGEAASEYLAKNRDGMSAEALMRAERDMKEVTARSRAQAFADDVMARGLKPDEALREAREKFTGTDEVAVVGEIKTRFAEREAIKAQQNKEASDEAWRIVSNGGGRKQIGPELWSRLPGEEQRQIGDWLEQKWRRAKADAEGKQEADWGAFMALTDMARDNPEKFMDPQTLLKAEPFLSKQQMASLMSLRTGLDKKDAKAKNLLTQIKDTETMVMADMRAAGLDTTPKEGSKQAKELVAFRGALQERLMAAQAEKGTALTPAELKDIGLGLLREGYEQGSGLFGFFQTKKRGYEMEPGKTYVSKRYSEIPPDIRQALEAELPPERGIYGNSRAREQQVERMYQRGIELGRFK